VGRPGSQFGGITFIQHMGTQMGQVVYLGIELGIIDFVQHMDIRKGQVGHPGSQSEGRTCIRHMGTQMGQVVYLGIDYASLQSRGYVYSRNCAGKTPVYHCKD
jgi:hypothetical protein